MQKAEGKPGRPPWSLPWWAGGAVLGLLALGVWAMREEAATQSRRPPLVPAGLGSHVSASEGAPPESLEDALKSLEGGDKTNFEPLAKVARPSRKPAKAAKRAERRSNEALDKLDQAGDGQKETVKKAMTKLGMDEQDPQDADLRARLEALLDGDPAGAGSEREPTTTEAPQPEDQVHLDFVNLLKEETERKHEHTLPTVKAEFTKEFAGEGRSLLCSGCKLVAARFGSELDNHDVHDSENPALMLASKRRALDATCSSLRHLHVVAGESGRLRFEAGEEPSGGPGQPGASQRLCTALLEETRFDVMTKLIQTKMPGMHQQPEAKHNWERWLCLQRARLCKRSEVREDDEDDEEL